ncbi:MAG: TetR/AcrR family transcriptional regulator, partial [Alphaproteobacteria bacterium]
MADTATEQVTDGADEATNAAAKAPQRRGGRRAESRRRLLDAARELFVSRGYHATRPQDITKAANLGHGTFYIHFKDKRECFLAFVDEAQQDLMTSIDEAAALIPAEASMRDS